MSQYHPERQYGVVHLLQYRPQMDDNTHMQTTQLTPLHSTQFTALAQAADEFGYVISAIVSFPRVEGKYAGGIALLHDPDRPADRAYAVSLGVLPDPEDRDGEVTAFFTSSTYDMDYASAWQSFTHRAMSELRLGAYS